MDQGIPNGPCVPNNYWLLSNRMLPVTHEGEGVRVCMKVPDSKVHEANMWPIWGQDPGGHHVGPMDFVIWGTSDRWNNMDWLCT